MHTVTIKERESDWVLIDRHYGVTRSYPNAIKAFRAIKRQQKREIKAGAQIAATQIEWEPITEIGRIAVQIIAEEK